MQVTDVRIQLVTDAERLKAHASVVFDASFAVHSIRVVEGINGLFVAMPRQKLGTEYKDMAHPITAEFRQHLNQAVMEGYHQAVQKVQQAAG